MMAARKISSHAAFAVAEVVGGSTLATDRFKSGLRVRPGVTEQVCAHNRALAYIGWAAELHASLEFKLPLWSSFFRDRDVLSIRTNASQIAPPLNGLAGEATVAVAAVRLTFCHAWRCSPLHAASAVLTREEKAASRAGADWSRDWRDEGGLERRFSVP